MTVPHGFSPLGVLNGAILALKGANDAGFQLAQWGGGQGEVVRLAPASMSQSLLRVLVLPHLKNTQQH